MFQSLDEEDRQLLARVIRQDERALKALMRRHQRLVYGLCLNVMANREDAEEAALEVFLKLWRKAEQHRGECSVKSFLCRIAINECRDRLRRRPILTGELAEARAEMSQDRLAILYALRNLDEEARLAIVLYHLDGLSVDEAAEALEISPGVLKMRLVRTRARLKLILEDCDE
jgi:RNA polymerase sigma-70 factor (ECF subfamily)